jgi:hypothetical protein
MDNNRSFDYEAYAQPYRDHIKYLLDQLDALRLERSNERFERIRLDLLTIKWGQLIAIVGVVWPDLPALIP